MHRDMHRERRYERQCQSLIESLKNPLFRITCARHTSSHKQSVDRDETAIVGATAVDAKRGARTLDGRGHGDKQLETELLAAVSQPRRVQFVSIR